MNEVKSVRRCYACGAIIQSEDKNAKGYVPADILAAAKEGAPVFCDNCFNEKSYNLTPKEASIGDDFLLMLSDAKKSNALILYIVDLFSFESSFIGQVSEMIRDLEIVVIANKRDLLPDWIDDEHLKEYVAHRFRVASLPVQKESVYLASFAASSHRLANSEKIKEALERRGERDVYLIGPKLGGKSFFISLFLKTYENRTGRNISTKEYPGTSLSLIDIPLSAHSSIYDTPGTGIDNSLLSIKDNSLQKAIALKKEVEGRTFSLSEGQALCLGGIARIDNLGRKKIKMVAYCSENVEAYRLKEGAKDEKFIKLIKREGKGEGVYSKTYPTLEAVQSLKDMDVFDFSFDEERCRDIGVAGLGWFTFESYSGLKLRIYVPKGIGVYGSRSKVGKV